MAEHRMEFKSEIVIYNGETFDDDMWAEWDSQEPDVRGKELWHTIFSNALEDSFGSDNAAKIATAAQFTDKDGAVLDIKGLSQLSSQEIITRGFATADVA